MAEIYRRVRGKKLYWWIARAKPARATVSHFTLAIALRAEANLAAHRYEGHSRIDIDEGHVDKYVGIDDSRGLNAALAIEGETRVLRDAAGL